MSEDFRKPLGGKSYGHIPHLPGSRRGPQDHGLSAQQASLLTVKVRDKHDLVTVQEKVDGSNVAAARIDGNILPITRSGYNAWTSNFQQHHEFAAWVKYNESRFLALLRDGERLCGEWLWQAHGTLYHLPHEPFVAFDIMRGKMERELAKIVCERCVPCGFTTPRVIHVGTAISIESILAKLEPSGHGAIDPVEGAVWRMERKGKVDFLGKYVRTDKVDGKYLPEQSGGSLIKNVFPEQMT